MLQVDTRRSTEDIDIFASVGGAQDQATGIPLAVALYQAAETVAQRYHLQPTWLNTIRAGALEPMGIDPQRILWKNYQILNVFLPQAEYVLVQKMLVNRRKDQGDIIALCRTLGITTRAQAQLLLDRYISPAEQQQRHLAIQLRAYFPS